MYDVSVTSSAIAFGGGVTGNVDLASTDTLVSLTRVGASGGDGDATENPLQVGRLSKEMMADAAIANNR